jgi:voltage-gated potassium channel
MGVVSYLPIIRSYNITDKFSILKYKFVQVNGIIFLLFFSIYCILFKLNKEKHFTYDKSYDMTSVVDVMYFTITTQSTVGYGDISPRSTLAKVVMMFHIASTIILIGLISSS